MMNFHVKSMLACCLLLLVQPSYAQSPAAGLDCERRVLRPAPTPLEEQTIARLAPLRRCSARIDDQTACNRYVGRALQILFNNNDFRNGNDFMLANDIANGLEQPGNLGWRNIGFATNQMALDEAQRLANEGVPVVAARLGALHDGTRGAGHVVLIIPGTTEAATSVSRWGVLRTPNSASFFLNNPGAMFVGCPLSVAWMRPDNVKLFSKR